MTATVSGTHARTFTANPMAAAACIGRDPALWFPDDDGPDNHGREAKAICAGCPVWKRCLVEALERREEHGIWGGAGETRRRVLRRALGTPAWPAVVAAHRRDLVGQATVTDRRLLAAAGEGATHGNRATYARGCRCEPCAFAAAAGTAVASITRAPRRSGRAAA